MVRKRLEQRRNMEWQWNGELQHQGQNRHLHSGTEKPAKTAINAA